MWDFVRPPFVNLLDQRLRDPSPLMQFVLGPRQVGKTTGVEMLLKEYNGKYHSVLAEDSFGHSHLWLREQWQKATEMGSGTLLVVDEIQKIENWSETTKFLWDSTKKQRKIIKCLFLGSSSLQLQKGLSESLAGRFELIQVPHWSFDQSQQLHKMSLQEYLQFGGYPGSYKFLPDHQRWRDYIRHSILESVLTKDILPFSQVRKPALFRQTVEILSGYPAQIISYTKLLGQLQDRGNAETIKSYLQLLDHAFLFKPLEKYSRKKHLMKASSPKILPLCPALTTAFHEDVPLGRRFEAFVGQLLLQNGGELFYWREGVSEVDFVYVLAKQVYAIEVKSGTNKSRKGLEIFLNKFPNSAPIFIDIQNVHKLKELLV